ncbi:MAG: DUF302 domain-containing protein [Porphyromonadaceae bacterium]|nr:DUF302 domain-containing protein [Porphyromonadaceae bacterium]
MENMFIEVQSKFDFEQTVEKLTETIEKANWKVQMTHNLQQSLQNHGYDVLPVKVIELCNPHHSSKILNRDAERIYSNLMPCRISVYDKSDGETYISLMNAGMMAKQIGGIVEEVMSGAFEDSMGFVNSVTK